MKRLFVCLIILLIVPATTRAQATNRAGLVLLGSDGAVRTYCVAFAEETISGVDLLQRAQLPIIAQTSGNNAAVCKIGDDGCNFPAENCFCRFGGGQRGEYWAFWQLNGGAWQYSQLGAGAARVRNGDVNGWAWGAGTSGTGAQPPVHTFEQICEQGGGDRGQGIEVRGQGTAAAKNDQAQATSGSETPAAAQPSNVPTFQPATSSQPAASSQPPTPNPQPLPYAVFGVLLLGSIGLIVLVLRRGGR